MTRNEILEELRNVLLTEGSASEEAVRTADEDTILKDDLGLTSVGMLYIVLGIEDTFSVDFSDVSMADFVTVKDVIDRIQKKQA